MNTYGYVSGNPLYGIDPAGLSEVNFGNGFTGRIDSFDYKGESSFEIHVYDKSGKKVGVHGPKGWIAKHGHDGKVPAELPKQICAQIKGTTIDELRKRDRFPTKGAVNIKGDNWKYFVKFGGKAAVVGSFYSVLSIEKQCAAVPTADGCKQWAEMTQP